MTAKAEHEMTGQELKSKYDALQPGDGWSEHPNFSHGDWALEASELNTLHGYWDWVSSQIEQRHDESGLPAESIPDPKVMVRQVGGPEGETEWFISQNLTDRWGDINYHNAENKPLQPLFDESFLERLRSQMVGEETFVVRKDGKFGILFETEFASKESEEVETFKPHEEVVEALMRGMALLVEKFPTVQFCVPDKEEIINERPAAWAFVADGLLDDQQRKEFVDAWYNL